MSIKQDDIRSIAHQVLDDISESPRFQLGIVEDALRSMQSIAYEEAAQKVNQLKNELISIPVKSDALIVNDALIVILTILEDKIRQSKLG